MVLFLQAHVLSDVKIDTRTDRTDHKMNDNHFCVNHFCENASSYSNSLSLRFKRYRGRNATMTIIFRTINNEWRVEANWREQTNKIKPTQTLPADSTVEENATARKQYVIKKQWMHESMISSDVTCAVLANSRQENVAKLTFRLSNAFQMHVKIQYNNCFFSLGFALKLKLNWRVSGVIRRNVAAYVDFLRKLHVIKVYKFNGIFKQTFAADPPNTVRAPLKVCVLRPQISRKLFKKARKKKRSKYINSI